MPRVKCPHCGAGNQDATEQDECWQCSKVLGAPVVREQMTTLIQTSSIPNPNTTASVPTQFLDPGQLQKLAESTRPTTRPVASGQQQKQAGNLPTMQLIVGILIVVVVILLAILLLRR